MTFTVKLSPTFKRQAKDVLSRYPAFKQGLIDYLKGLEQSAPRGDQIQRYKMLWKDRLGLKAYKRGLRVIMYFDGSESVFLIMIYCKRDIVQPTDKEIKDAITELMQSP